MKLAKFNEIGRSMVEMLGVLAIIGVLSVGAIAGYSKAMMKYKLNKQAQQLSHLLNVLHRYKHEWVFDSNNAIHLVPYYKELGEIPSEIIKKGYTNTIYDVFGSSITMTTNYCDTNPCRAVALGYISPAKNTFEVCNNIWDVIKSFQDNLERVGVYKFVENDDNPQYKYTYFGNKYCGSTNSNNRDCIKDINKDVISGICKYCEDSTQCKFYVNYLIND